MCYIDIKLIRKELKLLPKEERTKRLSIDVDTHVHTMIKTISAEKMLSITTWIKQAIAEKLEKEKYLGF